MTVPEKCLCQAPPSVMIDPISCPAAFQRATEALQEADPIGTNQIASLTLVTSAADGQWWVARNSTSVHSMALLSNHEVLLGPTVSTADAAEYGQIVGHLDDTLRKVRGPAAAIPAFVTSLQAARPQWVSKCVMTTLVYALVSPLTELEPPAPSCGTLRLATAADMPFLAAATVQYCLDTHIDVGFAETIYRCGLASQSLHVWAGDDAIPVAFASHAAPVHLAHTRVVRLTYVFTSPAARGRGVAGALTTAISRKLMASEPTIIMLNVDTTNARARRAYEKVGFEVRGEMETHVISANGDDTSA
ncbi:Aste57867_851 [Aphanomyces stellatus]|uniref:Aste57867_851 protein n=1 Tax=Aphanomyces stellatus TaxID=120398 RepID=A0A485K3N1_9STRA|nr:hypothetical protein As57867_000850 [Aphanomyces stellatus]VFT78075.1 Aste57867_851 [Aphanomyces stellatus]